MPMRQMKRPDGSCFEMSFAGNVPSAHDKEVIAKKGLVFASAEDLAACLKRAERNANGGVASESVG